jgi:hypothetical protein
VEGANTLPGQISPDPLVSIINRTQNVSTPAVTVLEYTGEPQTAKYVTSDVEGAVITYGTEKGTYGQDYIPMFTDVGVYTVYYQSVAAGYDDVEGSYEVIIVPAIKAEDTITKDYTTKPVELEEGTDYTIVPEGENYNFDTEVTYYAIGDDGELEKLDEAPSAPGTYKVTITVTDPENSKITNTETFTLKIKEQACTVEHSKFVLGYEMVRVYTDGDLAYTYDGNLMYEVSNEYVADNSATYQHVYAYLVKLDVKTDGDGTEVEYTALNTEDIAPLVATTAEKPLQLAGGLTVPLDVNGSDAVDLVDVITTICTYNGQTNANTAAYDLIEVMNVALKCDVNHDKVVDALDFGLVRDEVAKYLD